MEDKILKTLQNKNLSENSIKLYMSILKNLNDKKEIKDLKFLSKSKKIFDKIKDYKATTQRNILISIVSVLKALENPLYKDYYDDMMKLNKIIDDDTKKNQKTEQQEKNWMKWDEIVNKFNDMNSKLKKSYTNISESQYDDLLDTVILSLYVCLPPRRNKDYLLMKVSKDGKNMTDAKYNYLDMKKKQFIFNNFKTKKAFGQQIIDIPDVCYNLLKKYLKYKKGESDFLLVKFNGEHLKSDNAITRRLNNVFDKNVSSSMLRHIYLSDKYNGVKEEMKKDSNLMAHSTSQQADYIKN
jgi:integrase